MILIYSTTFAPRIGGIETVVQILAEEFVRLGETVKLVTLAENDGDAAVFPFEVIRRPSLVRLFALVKECDVVFHHNISLKALWPLILARRRFVVAHHTCYRSERHSPTLRDRVKLFAARFAVNISVSSAVGASLSVPSEVIPNPYRDDIFRTLPGDNREQDIAFVGRLVSDKGADTLLEALRLLAMRGVRPGLTIVGEGPERERLARETEEFGLADQVRFAGTVVGEALCRLLNAHRILAVPSRWDEPFGLVALEGIACGCLVLGSSGGGLAEAIGPCGRTFSNGDAQGLADLIESGFRDPELRTSCLKRAPEHLSAHGRRKAAIAYLGILRRSVISQRL